ncbi:Membrane protein involved in the export of O-antigen and teichoic acid [Rhizobium sp. RU33A]|uniref:lipopolysaccharide biosynthesis protein n=1 Tax=Rhizobium sp. RU33A TaxID=1907413 RepID=UPI000955A6B2|nr:oligosaccharide flippase family protein [Rhizobium sp. RU33A]SIQ45491.1 Membrane protein involved in the export of O-antigen and teichoic acid [Rhizobium sp. RU33A]
MIARSVARLQQALRDPGLRGALVSISVRIAAAFVGLGLQILLARLMALEDYGVYVILWTWVSVVGQIGVLGFYDSAARFIPRYGRREKHAHLTGYLATGFRAVILGSGLLAALAIAFLLVLPGLVDPAFLLPIGVLALGFPVLSLETYVTGVARGFGWYALSTVPGFILRPVLIMTGVGLARLSGLPLDAVTVLALVVLSSIVVLVVQALLLRARLPKTAAPAATTPERRRFWLLASVLMMPAMTAEELFVWIDVLILGFLVSPDQASLYFAAQRSLSLAAFVQYGFMLVAARGFSLSLASADRAGLQARITRSTNATFWLTIPSVALTLAAGYPLLHLFGEAFVSAYPCLVLLGLAYIVRAATGQAAELLVVQGRYRLSLAIVSISVAACLGLMLLLVPLYGITGAAAAMVLVQIVRLVVVTGLVHRHTGYWVLARPFTRIAAQD